MYNYLLFDLDGTLTNPAIGITNSVMYALDKFGISVTDRAKLYCFIGPTLYESFSSFYGFDAQKTELAISYYREYFSEKGIFENTVYPKIPELLKELKNNGKKVILATAKPLPFAKKILEHFNLLQYFDFLGGATFDQTRNQKAQIINYVLDNYPISDRQNAVMIGDRKHDVLGAKATNISSIGVLYGFGSWAELNEQNPTHLAETVDDLKNLLLK